MNYRNLYIHVPFCGKKCSYCAFYSEEKASEELFSAWLNKMEHQLTESSKDLQQLHTIYLGGGTPTFPPAGILHRLFDVVSTHCTFDGTPEITSECNPETLTEEKTELLASFANRISMGVQTFNPDMLNRIGRRSSGFPAIENAFRLLRKNGIENIGMDLIYALPRQNMEDWKTDLKKALELNPSHISAYSLSVEEGTPLDREDFLEALPDDGLSAEMWEFAGEFLGKHGLPRYEISNYASPDHECRHNQNVWHGESYLGLGPSASSFDGSVRFTQVPLLSDWLNGTPPEWDRIAPELRAREIFIMGLRTVRGWNRHELKATFPKFQETLCRLEKDGLLHLNRETIRPTEKGLLFWNELAGELLG